MVTYYVTNSVGAPKGCNVISVDGTAPNTEVREDPAMARAGIAAVAPGIRRSILAADGLVSATVSARPQTNASVPRAIGNGARPGQPPPRSTRRTPRG